MRQSHIFVKSRREAPRDEKSRNAILLTRAGYIHKEMAGVYAYLPLGFRVLTKIEQIIREAMTALGGQEVLLTTLQNPEIWAKTGRFDDSVIDNWFKTNLHDGDNYHSGSQLGLANTHEEPLTALVAEHINSYRDLPVYVYQFQTKFRNELRAKSGIMRGREFLMKDLYSFSRTEAEFKEFYEQCAKSYLQIFDRVGLGEITFRTFASGGSFSDFSDEFQTLSEAGEDIIYLNRDRNIALNKEVYNQSTLDKLNLKASDLEEHKAIEVGNIFPLGTKFSDSLNLSFKDETGQMKPVIMGSYGIGLGRLMGAIAEITSDDRGLVWPKAVAPYQIHLLNLTTNGRAAADSVYQFLTDQGIEVLFDDRDLGAGQKLTEADLLGLPYRGVLSDKLKPDQIELKARTADVAQVMTLTEAVSFLTT